MEDQGIVADGRARARRALEPRIRAEVEQDFADRLENASFLKRQRLQVQIEAEIRRRLRVQAPPEDALY